MSPPSSSSDTVVRVVHVSDLHISEQLVGSTSGRFKLPHRYGHDFQAFTALDAFLNTNPWDVLVISGDVSRIGNIDSFLWAKTWIEQTVTVGAASLGLGLATKRDRHYVVVPGNHDRFNGQLKQTTLDEYHQYFPTVRIGTTVAFAFGSTAVNFHVFDSSDSNRTFAKGKISGHDLTPRAITDKSLDIAVLHHHFIQPPNHRRERHSELTNSQDVSEYMLTTGFDAVFFGHTHKSFVAHLPIALITKMFAAKGHESAFWKYVPRKLVELLSANTTLDYRREQTQDGKFPTIESYFTYLYIREVLGQPVTAPGGFRNVAAFYAHLSTFADRNNLTAEIDALKKRKVLISMAPSACQAEASRKGFHLFDFAFSGGLLTKIQSSVYELRPGGFQSVRDASYSLTVS